MPTNRSTLEKKPQSRLGDKVHLISITLLVLATLIAINSRTLADADLWGHLRFGLDFLETGKLTEFDPYSYLSTGQRWINHEWLAEVLFALAWSAANQTGLILLKTSVGVLTLGLVYFYLINLKIPPIRAGIFVILAWAAIFPTIATVRPHMFTLSFTAILFIILALAESGKYRWLWAAPPVFALWVNFHGGFLAGLGFLGIWAFVHTILHYKNWIRIIPSVILSFFAVLINPYGLDLIVFLLRTATVSRPEIAEWHPISITSLLGIVYLFFVLITILGLVFSKWEKSIPKIILLGVAALLPLIAIRHLPLFSLAVLVFAGDYIVDAWPSSASSNTKPSQRPKILAIISVISALILMIWGATNFSRIMIPNLPIPFYPDRAVSLLQSSKVSGNLAVEFNWGEYVIWHLSPDIKVSVDGRRETIYPDDIYQENMSFLYGVGQWDALIDNHLTDMVLVSLSYPVYNLMKLKDGWDLIYSDSTSALFASIEWSQYDKLANEAAAFSQPPPKDYFP